MKKGDELEIQEIFLDKSSEDKKDSILAFEKKIEVPLVKRKIYFLFGIFIVLLMLLFAKAFFFQIIQHKSLSVLAEKNRAGIYLIRPLRGIIYDKNFNQLVTNKTVFDLICEKNILPFFQTGRDKEILEIAEILEMDAVEIKEKIKSSDEERILIFKNLPHQKFLEISSKIDNLPGFRIEETIIRNYISGSKFSHLIGYTSKINREELKIHKDYGVSDIIGRVGLEKFYEEILRGEVGFLKIERDAFGKEIKKEVIKNPKAGESIVLWLDYQLQEKIVEILEKNLKHFGLKKAAIVVMNPNTGGILSLVSFPTFDNNLFSQGADLKEFENLFKDPNNPLLNRVIFGLYPTGSAIKPLIAVAALEEKIISSEKKINCQGEISIHSLWAKVPTVYHDWKEHGLTDMRKAIAESCNVYFYTIGGGYKDFKGLGPEIIKKYLKTFGLENKTGIDLPEEKSGNIPDPEWKINSLGDEWRTGDTYNLSIGQGFLRVTPLEVAVATAALSNGGKILQPSLLQKIQPKVIQELPFSQENLKVVKEGMRQAVTSGTAVILNSLPKKVAAKTGTAQTSKEEFYHQWITIFAPYEEPQIVLTILIEDVKEEQLIATVLAKEILEWYFAREANLQNEFKGLE